MAPHNLTSLSTNARPYVSSTYEDVFVISNKVIKPFVKKPKKRKYDYGIYNRRQSTHGVPINVSRLFR